MANSVIDLRSDTVTHPTDEMRRAMASAEVGDDVYGEDPSMNKLEEMAAGLLGKEAALFTASGTMSNLIAALTHCRRGDEIVMGSEAHMMWNEVAGAATLAAAQVRTVPNDDMGRIDPQALHDIIRTGGNIQYPPTGLVCLENTHNRCNGGVLDAALTKSLADVAHSHGVPVHLDGARIFNASVASGSACQLPCGGRGRRVLLPFQGVERTSGVPDLRQPGVRRQGQKVAQNDRRRYASGRSPGSGWHRGPRHHD